MWPFEDELEEHFAGVKQKRADKMGVNNSSDDSGGIQNEYARGLRG